MVRSIMGLFAESPFEHLVKHLGQVKACSDLLREFIKAYCNEDFESSAELARKIVAMEREADKTKNYIREHLPRSILMPVNRGDLLNYLREQDQVADRIEEVALNLGLKRMKLPHSIKEQLIDLTNKACDTVDVIPPALDCIIELLETSFADEKKKEEYCGYVNELDIKEEITDHAVIEMRKRLFDMEKEFTHGEFYLMMRLTRQLARIADHAENCGDRMRVMVARQ
ncbi:MAG: TIGR00153 family protein [Methanobacteriota archaeon]